MLEDYRRGVCDSRSGITAAGAFQREGAPARMADAPCSFAAVVLSGAFSRGSLEILASIIVA